MENLNGKFNVVELPVHESPVFLAAAFPVQTKITGLKARLPAGRGFSRAQAMLSAAAEANELLAILATSKDNATVEHDTAEVAATRLSDGQRVSVQAQEVFLDWAAIFDEPLIHDADSSGCAAGQTLEDATSRAILECVERDALAIWWYGKQSRQHLPLSYIDMLHPRLGWWLDHRLRRSVFIDITSDLGIPTYAAVSCEPDGTGVAIGAAAHIQTSSALLSAITEMIQTEVSMQIGSSPENHDQENWQNAAKFQAMKQFKAIEGFAQERHLAGSLMARLNAVEISMLRVDLTQQDNVFSVVRVMAPELCKMNRGIVAERIFEQARAHPEYGGAIDIGELEEIEPY